MDTESYKGALSTTLPINTKSRACSWALRPNCPSTAYVHWVKFFQSGLLHPSCPLGNVPPHCSGLCLSERCSAPGESRLTSKWALDDEDSALGGPWRCLDLHSCPCPYHSCPYSSVRPALSGLTYFTFKII